MFRSEAEPGGAAGPYHGSGGRRRGHSVPHRSFGFLRVSGGLEVLEVHPQLRTSGRVMAWPSGGDVGGWPVRCKFWPKHREASSHWAVTSCFGTLGSLEKALSASGLRFSKPLQLHSPSWLGGGCRRQKAEGLRKAELSCHVRKRISFCSGPLPMSDPLLGTPSPTPPHLHPSIFLRPSQIPSTGGSHTSGNLSQGDI